MCSIHSAEVLCTPPEWPNLYFCSAHHLYFPFCAANRGGDRAQRVITLCSLSLLKSNPFPPPSNLAALQDLEPPPPFLNKWACGVQTWAGHGWRCGLFCPGTFLTGAFPWCRSSSSRVRSAVRYPTPSLWHLGTCWNILLAVLVKDVLASHICFLLSCPSVYWPSTARRRNQDGRFHIVLWPVKIFG